MGGGGETRGAGFSAKDKNSRCQLSGDSFWELVLLFKRVEVNSEVEFWILGEEEEEERVKRKGRRTKRTRKRKGIIWIFV